MAEMQSDIGRALKIVREKIAAAALRRPPELSKREPRLVAVSKTKSKEAIIEAYSYGQRHFGENYKKMFFSETVNVLMSHHEKCGETVENTAVQELIQKGRDAEIIEKCSDIRWHVIGHVQGNKVNKIVDIPNLYMVETVDSDKLASSLNTAWLKSNKPDPLNVMVQVNTSSEDNKSGIEPKEAHSLVDYIFKNCPKLKFVGLMTIGAYDHDPSKGPNPDFQTLLACRKDVCNALSLEEDGMELSMGMSSDYEHAVEVGSTNIRVGSNVFGGRS